MSEHDQLLRLPKVLAMTGLSRATLYVYIKEGRFPDSYAIGERAKAWSLNEVQAWIQSRKRRAESIHFGLEVID